MKPQIEERCRPAWRISRSHFGFALLLLSAIGLAPGGSAAEIAAKPVARLASHKLQPMDLVKIQVHREPDLDREVRVSQDSTIVVPLLGLVDVTGRTVAQVQVLITELYRQEYLVNPQINLAVIEYASRTINVLGAVNSPGLFPLPPEKNLTFLDAIARSGGFSRVANRNKVVLIRTLPDGKTVNYTIDADQLTAGELNSRWPVQDGDTILVPERLL